MTVGAKVNSTGLQGSGFRVKSSDCRVQGSGLIVQGAGLRVEGSGFRVQGSGLRVEGSGFRVQGSGLRVQALAMTCPRRLCTKVDTLGSVNRGSQERLTRGTVTSRMCREAHPSRCARCGAGAGCSATIYPSL